MPKVTFYPLSEMSDKSIKFAVIAAQYHGKWIYCRHKERNTWEVPGGHREPGETPLQTARRELWEETGAVEAVITPVCGYSFSDFGVLYYAEVQKMEQLPEISEIAEISLFDPIPDNLTYPHIQPFLFHQVIQWLEQK